MTETEHLLTCLAEECNEVAQRVTKALRFGLGEIQPGQRLDNDRRIANELSDLEGVLALLRERGLILQSLDHADRVFEKKEKVLHFMGYSRKLGTLA